MFTHLQCIALRRTPVSDSRVLLNVWSRQAGPLTLAFPAGSGREARRRRALCGPMAIFEGAADVRPGREVVSMRDFMPLPGSVALAAPDVPRDMVAAFLAELLSALLRRSSPDADLSDYLFAGATRLGSATCSPATFHLEFLAGLTAPMGIAPDLSAAGPGMIFDMREACFRPSMPLHRDVLEGDDAAYFAALVRAYNNIMPGADGSPEALAAPRDRRMRTLQGLLDYYAIHLGALPPLKSLEVLRGLF